MARYRKCMTTGTCKYCPIGARFSGQLILDELRSDERNINLEIRTNSPATQVLVDSKSRIRGVEYLDGTTGERRHVYAGTVVVCSGAYESPKLLMLSKSRFWKNGIGNDYDLLGRYLVSHSILKVRGELNHNEENWFQEYDFPTLMSKTYDTAEYQKKNKIFLFKNRGLPNIDFAALMIKGKSRAQIDEIWRASRQQELQAFMEEMGDKENRITLLPGRNRFGLPKMRIQFDRSAQAQRNGEEWLDRMKNVIRDMGYRLLEEKTQIDPPGGASRDGDMSHGKDGKGWSDRQGYARARNR